ncbi:N-acetyltransferase family protein [Sphingopyxis sp.]|uniref:GNAT family N-acetyltransferase n=1 Tax=Sphingopyxis sp. TaxID=1908224 RepID=UPI0035B3FAEC
MSDAPTFTVTPATPDDAKPVAAIYAHHVAHGTATYDIEPRSVLATAGLISEHRAKDWPFLIARDENGAVAGYAYASQFRDRPAYAWTCEDSIYVGPAHQGRGIGRALLDALLVTAEAAGFRTMIAVIGGAEPASVALHARCGFAHAGRLEASGWKQGRWLDTVFMQRALGAGAASPPPG